MPINRFAIAPEPVISNLNEEPRSARGSQTAGFHGSAALSLANQYD